MKNLVLLMAMDLKNKPFLLNQQLPALIQSYFMLVTT